MYHSPNRMVPTPQSAQAVVTIGQYVLLMAWSDEKGAALASDAQLVQVVALLSSAAARSSAKTGLIIVSQITAGPTLRPASSRSAGEQRPM